MPDVFSIDSIDLTTIIHFITGIGINSLESELLSWAMTW